MRLRRVVELAPLGRSHPVGLQLTNAAAFALRARTRVRVISRPLGSPFFLASTLVARLFQARFAFGVDAFDCAI